MDYTMIQDIINNMGFPIAMVAYFIWDKYKTMQPMIDAINNNTKILTVLCDKLELKEVAANE